MDDKQLLELAAKAAGIVIAHNDGNVLWVDFNGVGLRAWNPLKDDGDALRLAVRLSFWIDIERPCGVVDIGPAKAAEQFQHEDYIAACAATRRAIVRAAAEVGKRMEGGQ